MPKITASAIKVNGKIFEGKHHDDALAKAKSAGYDTSKVDKEKEGLFRVSDGRLITRSQAKEEFGITHSEEVFDKDKMDKKLNILVLDCGIFTGIANSLSMGGKNKVFYHTNWSADPFPKLQDFAPGTDYEYITKIKRLYIEIDFNAKDAPIYVETGEKIDCVICFDVGRNDEIDSIKQRYPNLSVVGSGIGEILEEDRVGLKKICKKLGLDVNDYEVKIGIDALMEYCKKNKDIYVKIDIWRQSMETMNIESIEQAEKDLTFEELKVEFGPVFSKKIPFIIEKEIKSKVEIGFDGWYTPGFGYMDKCFCGYEYSKGPYLTKVFNYKDLPKPILETMDKFIPILKALDYRGYLSTEEKITKDGKHYLLDWCSRLLSPGSALYPYAIKNWDELNYKIGKKENCIAETEFKYYGALPLFSDEGKDSYVHIKIDPKYKENIRFMGVCSDGKDYYSIKGKQGMVCLVAGSNKWESVIEKLKELVDYVKFEGLDKNYMNMLDKFPELIKKGYSVGVDF